MIDLRDSYYKKIEYNLKISDFSISQLISINYFITCMSLGRYDDIIKDVSEWKVCGKIASLLGGDVK